jgi:transposase
VSRSELEALVVELRRLIGKLESTIETLNVTVAVQAARIVELEEKLGESRRAGKRQAAPFSKGDPAPEPKAPGRKPGAACGRHVTRSRPEHVDREVEVRLPEVCGCGGEIEPVEVAQQYVIDLPKPEPVVTRFNVAVGRCRCCKRRVQGRHSEQTSEVTGIVDGVQIGPNAIATGLVMHYQHGLSFGRCAELLGRLGVAMHPSTLVRAGERVAGDLEATCAALLAELNAAAAVVMDETGWRIGGMPAWLWAATTATTTVYAVCEGRGFDDATMLLNAAFDGVLIRDGWAPYRCYTEASHQTGLRRPTACFAGSRGCDQGLRVEDRVLRAYL